MHYNINMSFPKQRSPSTLKPAATLPKSSTGKPVPQPIPAQKKKQQQQQPRAARSQKSKPLDAEDLTRRLRVVIAEQKAHAEKKRRAVERRKDQQQGAASVVKGEGEGEGDEVRLKGVRDAKVRTPKAHKVRPHVRRRPSKEPAASQTVSCKAATKIESQDDVVTYSHIPKVAATQFARTTTVETPADRAHSHKLSQTAIKFHLEGPNASQEIATLNEKAAPREQALALRRAQSQRERTYERNQFASPASLNVEMDESGMRPQRHLLEPHLKTEGIDPSDDGGRRRSTGSYRKVIAAGKANDSEALTLMAPAKRHNSCDGQHLPSHAGSKRADWTQSDENDAPKSGLHGLRKLESKLHLRGRLGRHGKDEKPLSPTSEEAVAEEGMKSPRSNFFARFKR